jgi:hypothetical protein
MTRKLEETVNRLCPPGPYTVTVRGVSATQVNWDRIHARTGAPRLSEPGLHTDMVSQALEYMYIIADVLEYDLTMLFESFDDRPIKIRPNFYKPFADAEFRLYMFEDNVQSACTSIKATVQHQQNPIRLMVQTEENLAEWLRVTDEYRHNSAKWLNTLLAGNVSGFDFSPDNEFQARWSIAFQNALEIRRLAYIHRAIKIVRWRQELDSATHQV